MKYIFLFSKEATGSPTSSPVALMRFSLLSIYFTNVIVKEERKLPTVLPHQLSLVFCVPPVLIYVNTHSDIPVSNHCNFVFDVLKSCSQARQLHRMVGTNDLV